MKRNWIPALLGGKTAWVQATSVRSSIMRTAEVRHAATRQKKSSSKLFVILRIIGDKWLSCLWQNGS
ncbi:MAG: hypothetical protein WA715_09425 [Candidatus Acidiferrum sp.]